MAGSVTFNISPNVLHWARSAMGYSIEETAAKIGVNIEKYLSWENGENKPTYKQLENLAEKVYKRPMAVLLMNQPPVENEIQKDFRNLSNSEIETISPDLRLALRKAKRYQYILEEVVAVDEETPRLKFPKFSGEDPDVLAARLRDFMGFSIEEQKSWNAEDAHRNFQKKVEEFGIYVFKMRLPFNEARAFCLTGSFPVIILNTEDSGNGRIFSLFHEVCHILINTNDLFRDKNDNNSNSFEYQRVESFCNKFAASFLVPEQDFNFGIREYLINESEISDHTIELFAYQYKVSKEVIARKLISYDLLSEKVFWSKKRSWDAIAKAAKEKRNERLKDSSTGINQSIKILSEKGRPYVFKVYNAYVQGQISSSDVSNYLETKLTHLPKIAERLFN